jgi:isoleucyl-tRNA synthetase
VWFDSGTTHQTVLRGSHAQQSQFPADLYLEGSTSTAAGSTRRC